MELELFVKEHEINNVTFWGFKNQSELPKYYNDEDFLILPSGYGET